MSGLLIFAPLAEMQAQFAYSTNADGSVYAYSTNADGSANIAAYSGPPWAVTIPTNINGLTVTGIGLAAFGNLTNLASVTIPGSVTSIGQFAFAQCDNLTNAAMTNSVTSINYGAFEYCASLASVTIPGSVTNM